jgi:hypothetical protein
MQVLVASAVRVMSFHTQMSFDDSSSISLSCCHRNVVAATVVFMFGTHMFTSRNEDACRVRVRVSGNLHLGTPIDVILLYRAIYSNFLVSRHLLVT